jgi:hypothetical protein
VTEPHHIAVPDHLAVPDLLAIPDHLAVRVDLPFATTLFAWAALLIVASLGLLGLAAIARRQDRSRRADQGAAGPAEPRDRTPPAVAPGTQSVPHQRGGGWGRRRPRADECERLRAEAAELAGAASAVAAKAQRAIAEARATDARWGEAQRAREETGRAFDAAQRAYDRTLTAWREAEARKAARVRDEQEEEQDREVSRAALHAFRAGHISADELREVFKRTGGWDPVQEEREREIALLRAEAHRTHRVYDAAVAAERIAAKSAGVASIAAQALIEEAEAAAQEAAAAGGLAEECARSGRRGRRSPR